MNAGLYGCTCRVEKAVPEKLPDLALGGPQFIIIHCGGTGVQIESDKWPACADAPHDKRISRRPGRHHYPAVDHVRVALVSIGGGQRVDTGHERALRFMHRSQIACRRFVTRAAIQKSVA